MKNIKMLVFDMDGTIADLYGIENWLPMLQAENPYPYRAAMPMWDMQRLTEILRKLQCRGVQIAVVTWLSKDSSEEYKTEVRKAKREWLAEQNFPFDFFHGVQFGSTKANSIRHKIGEFEQAILFDDSDKVRKGWTLGETVNPNEQNLIEFLQELL